MNERTRRLWAGAEADVIGYGGVAAVARATGMAIDLRSLNIERDQLHGDWNYVIKPRGQPR